MMQRRKVSSGSADQYLTHCRGEMSNRRAIILHPLGELFVLNVVSRRYQKLSSKKQRCENISLNRVMCNATCGVLAFRIGISPIVDHILSIVNRSFSLN